MVLIERDRCALLFSAQKFTILNVCVRDTDLCVRFSLSTSHTRIYFCVRFVSLALHDIHAPKLIRFITSLAISITSCDAYILCAFLYIVSLMLIQSSV